MSTVNTIPTPKLPELREPKFTAPQIEKDCPARLQQIGREITERLKKAEKQAKLAADQVVAVDQLLAEAKVLCDEGGFNAFQQMFFPDLGKSRVYELLAIGTNKKSAEEIRSNTRARVAKHRANKAADAQFRYSNGNSDPDAQDAPNENGEIEAPGIASAQTSEPEKPRRAVTPGDEALRDFTVRVLELDRTTKKKPPKRFSGTAVQVEILEQLGNRLIDIAKHKKFDDVEATPAAVLRGTVSDEKPAEDTEAERPVQDAKELHP